MISRRYVWTRRPCIDILENGWADLDGAAHQVNLEIRARGHDCPGECDCGE